MLFNDKTTLLHNREPIDKVPNLTLEDYQVGSNTALLDAVGDTISKMQENRKITKIITFYSLSLLMVKKIVATNIVNRKLNL